MHQSIQFCFPKFRAKIGQTMILSTKCYQIPFVVMLFVVVNVVDVQCSRFALMLAAYLACLLIALAYATAKRSVKFGRIADIKPFAPSTHKPNAIRAVNSLISTFYQTFCFRNRLAAPCTRNRNCVVMAVLFSALRAVLFRPSASAGLIAKNMFYFAQMPLRALYWLAAKFARQFNPLARLEVRSMAWKKLAFAASLVVPLQFTPATASAFDQFILFHAPILSQTLEIDKTSLGAWWIMPELFEIAGERLRVNMHSGQTRAWDSNARIVAMIAGSQGGKTSWGPLWLQREIALRGGGDYMAVTSSFDLFKLKMLPAIRLLFEHTLGIGRYWAGDKILELRNPETGQFEAKRADDPMWGRIILRSAAAEGGLEATTAKGAWLDEAGQDDFSLTAYEAIRRRLTIHRGRILITTTPYNLGWLKQQIVDRADSDPEIEIINFDSIANPNFSIQEYEDLRRDMPTWKFNMYHRGLFVRPPGMIYSDFIDEYRERGGHKVKPFAVPAGWNRLVGVDPGVINTCKVWLAQDPEGNLFVYRESLGERKSAGEHAHDALDLARRENEHVIRWAVGAKSEIYHREDWIKAGAKGVVEPKFADVEARIDCVIAWLRNFRLFFFETCTGVLDQLGRYSREIDAMGQPTEKIKDKEAFHYLDALGYIVMSMGIQRRTVTAEVRRWA